MMVSKKPKRRRTTKKKTVQNDQNDKNDKDQNLPTDQSSKPKKNKRKQSKPVRNIKKERLWPCKRCDKVFIRSTLLRAHRKIHVTPKKPELVTDELTYEFDDNRNLYICNACSAEHKEKVDAEEHIRAHKEIFKCPVCDTLFYSAYSYGTHMVTHSDDKIYRCYYCTYTTSKRQSLLVHINYMHLKKFYYTCEKCGRGFNDLIVFKEHENEHLGIRPFICVVCNKDYPYSKYLRGHQIRYHYVRIEGVPLPNQCSVCSKVFAKAATLDRHFQEEHVNNMLNRERKYLCDLCGKGFLHKDKLKLHYRIHTGEKPFSCSFCAKSFTKKNYLEMHERIHTGEKPYSCQFCGKSFSQKATLNIHLRTHTGERPFACNICEMKFTSKGTLNLHYRNCKGIPFNVF